MYQFLVGLIFFSFIFGCFYFINKTDAGHIVSESFSKVTEKKEILKQEDVIGTYICNQETGCSENVLVNLSLGGQVKMITSYSSGQEVNVESGSYSLSKNIIDLVLKSGPQGDYDIPHFITIKSISTSTLSQFVYDKKIYNYMKNPVFLREEE